MYYLVAIKYGDYKSYNITINNYIAILRNNIKHFNERKVNKHRMEKKIIKKILDTQNNIILIILLLNI